MEIDAISWFDEPIKSSVNSVFSDLNSSVEALDILNKYRGIHFEILRSIVGSVKILGMQNPVALKDLYYPVSITTDIRRRIYAPEWGIINNNDKSPLGQIKPSQTNLGRRRVQKNREAGDAYISNNSRVVVLGGPGAGKTTFLKFLALAYSEQEIFKNTKLNHSWFPIYIHLPLLAKSNIDLIEHIAESTIRRTDQYAFDFYKRIIEKGQCIILLDSLDEVPMDSRKGLISQIRDFSKTYPKARMVISCRTADYDQVFDDFCEVELARLSKEGVDSIVKAWFGKNDNKRAEKLIHLLSNDEAVASLTETPLLLGLLCIQFKNDLALPKRKTELYRRCVDALLRDWDTTRGFRRDTLYSNLSDDRKEKVFEAVAGGGCSESITYEFPEAGILELISNEICRFSLDPNDARGILSEIESHHGIIEKCSAESYEFSHGTMHEYFAARYFVAKRIEIEVLKKNYENESWHNVILFMISMMDDSSSLIEFLIQKSSLDKFQNYPAFGRRLAHLLLLYRCITMGVNLSPALRVRVCNHLVKSQVKMLAQINSDGVLPYAAKQANGVRQALFIYDKTRPSLNKILKPYRSLMNEMVLSPIKEYSDSVIKEINSILSDETTINLEKIGVLTCLLVPISDLEPKYFLEKFMQCTEFLSKSRKYDVVKNVLVESINMLRISNPDLFREEIAIP